MTTQQEHFPDEDGIASVAREIRLLVEMIIEHAGPWLESIIVAGHGDDSAGMTGQFPDEGESMGHAAPSGEDGWCPLCAVVAVVRGQRPEFAARLLEQAARLVALLRAVLADRWYPDSGLHMPGFEPSESSAAGSSTGWPGGAAEAQKPRRDRQRTVQHIAVRPRRATSDQASKVSERDRAHGRH